MKIPIVKEWGSWIVFSSSCLAGLIAGLLTQPWLKRDFTPITVLTILGLTFLINSKNPLSLALRVKEKKEHIMWFLSFMLTGTALLLPFLIEGVKTFLPFVVLILSYVVLLSIGEEHHIMSELNGFALLTIAAPIVYFTVTGDMSWKIYFAVTIYFAAGVFKVKLRLKKTFFFRCIMILYCIIAALFFYIMKISLLLLIPLSENILAAIWLRDERLRTTGNIEFIKSVLFILFIGIFWR